MGPGSSRMSFALSPFVYPFTCLSQLGISTVALSVPVVLLRRQRAARALTKAPPPRRKAWPPPTPRAGPTTAVPAAARVEPIQVPKPSKAEIPSDSDFNGAFYSAKAFGIATALVTMGAFIGVWAVQVSLGVQNVGGIFLSHRIHRV